MADVHDNVVVQQQQYENQVMFFLAPEEYFPVESETQSPCNTQEHCDYPRKNSSEFDQSQSKVTLYEPRPTLKELAEAKTRRRNQRKSSSSLSTSSPINDPKFNTGDDGDMLQGEKNENERDKVMTLFSNREHEFREQFQIAAENMLQNTGEIGSRAAKITRSTSHYPQKNAGFRHLDSVLQLMQQLTLLQHENHSLRKKCSFLEDTKSLISLQYQMQTLVQNKANNKTSSLLTKAGKQVMHYLTSPTSAVTSSPLTTYSRVHSDVIAFTTDAIEEKPKAVRIQRSSSFGSIDDLDSRARRDIVERTNASQHCEKSSFHKASKSSTRKKPNKRFAPKWSKMKRVFGKQESGPKTEHFAVSAEEIVRLNKKCVERSRPPGLMNSKSLDHGELGSPWIVSDKLLGVEPPKSTPPSPSSIQSEPSTSFPATTNIAGVENEYAEIGPPSVGYVALDSKFKNSMSCYSETSEQRLMFEHSGEERLTASDQESDGQKYDQNTPRLIRRKSSPNLSMSSLSDSKHFLDAPAGDRLRRSSSYKISKRDRKHFQDRSITDPAYIQENLLSPADARQARLLASVRAEQEDMHRRARAAWIRVKDMIHTRKDSIRKQRRRTMSGDDIEVSPEGSSWEDRQNARSDLEYDFADHHYCTISREGSPKLEGNNSVKATSSSPQLARKRTRSVKRTEQGNNTPAVKKESTAVLPTGQFDVSALMGGMSDEFSKKMQDWEDKKRRGFTGKETSEDISTKFSEDFIRRMEAWEKMKGIVNTSPPKTRDSMPASPPPRSPPVEVPPASSIEPVAEHLSESFSKTVQEWERIKEKRVKKTPEPGSKGRSRQSERSKSGDRLPREKSRQRYEREIQKREQKLEKERQKLEKMKMRLENPDGKESLPLDIFKKLQEWDVIRNLKSDPSRELLPGEHHSRSRSEKHYRESISVPRERIMSDSSISPAQLQRKSVAYTLGGEESGLASPLVDDSTSIDLSVTMETIALLEDTNMKLSQELQVREDDLNGLQEDMQQLTDQMNAMNREYTQQIEQYKKELWASSKLGGYTIENESVTTSLKELKQKLNQLQEFGEQVMIEKRNAETETMEQLRMRVEREEALLAQIEAVQSSLDKKAYIQGTEVFQKLYQYISNVQKQVSSLKEGVLERNSVIDNLQRHLLVQEVTNKLMTSQLHQRDVTIKYLREKRKAGVLKRWKTFHGHDVIIREDGMVSLRKKDPTNETEGFDDISSEISRVMKDGLRKDREDALALHFDWLEGMQDQIQEVQDSQRFDVDVQTDDADVVHSDAQTMMSLMDSQLPLSRVLWDGTLLPVSDKGVQNEVSTADAAVYIEDVEVYDLKQRGKWRRRKKVKEETPQRGTVFRRMEIFETSRSRELKAQRKLAANSKDASVDDADTKTVIGKKILDYEHSEKECRKSQSEDNIHESSEVVIVPNKNRSINKRDISTSPEDPGIDSHFVCPTHSPDAAFPPQRETGNCQLQETNLFSKNGKDSGKFPPKPGEEDRGHIAGENMMVDECIEVKVSAPVASEVVLKSSEEDLDGSRSEPSSPLYKDLLGSENVSTNMAKPPKLPLSPIIRSKYARKLKVEGSSPKQRKFFRHRKPSIERLLQGGKKESSCDLKSGSVEVLEPMRNRARSENSVLTSKYGSDEVEETTAAKFTINVEKYMLRSRRDQAGVENSTGITLPDLNPFSQQNRYRKSPLGTLAITPVHNLKSADQLLVDPYESENVQEGQRSLAGQGKVTGYTTPSSLPSSSPVASKRLSSQQTLEEMTKRFSLPQIYITTDEMGQGHSTYHAAYKYNSSPFTTVKRKAFVLEPFSFEIEKKQRPRSVISYSTETEHAPHTHESVWKKLMGSRSPKLPRMKSATAPRNLGFKMFGKKKDKPQTTQGAVTQLCLQALSVETTHDVTAAAQPDTGQNSAFDQPGTSFADSHDPDAADHPVKKKTKVHFLDSKWLAKPRRFFRGSKMHYNVIEGTADASPCGEVEDSNGSQGNTSGWHNNKATVSSEDPVTADNASITIIHNKLV